MTCESCLHYSVCALHHKVYMIVTLGEPKPKLYDGVEEKCYLFADKSRFVELPCKIGDTVWCIRNFHGHKHAQEGIVSEMLFTKEMKLQIVVKYVGCGNWGEKIFATREAAEAAINKKEKENEVN